KGSLAVVHMGDDGHIANVGTLHAKGSRVPGQPRGVMYHKGQPIARGSSVRVATVRELSQRRLFTVAALKGSCRGSLSHSPCGGSASWRTWDHGRYRTSTYRSRRGGLSKDRSRLAKTWRESRQACHEPFIACPADGGGDAQSVDWSRTGADGLRP